MSINGQTPIIPGFGMIGVCWLSGMNWISEHVSEKSAKKAD
ncbi:hypothetical protein ABTQ33_02690 [Paucilactobacillus suebicus]|nr:hypothetical protein [Paucilactobacillus suebicus]